VTTKAQRKLFFKLRKLRKSLGALGHQEAQEIATELDVAPQEVRRMEERLYGRDVAFHGIESENHLPAPEDFLSSNDDPQQNLLAIDGADNRQRQLTEALQSLDPRSRAIIRARWLQQPKKTLTELGDQFVISAERIRQLEKSTLAQLRSLLAN